MTGDKKHILICGNYGAGNLGDEAILDGLIYLVNSCWSGCDITVMSSRPSVTRREHKIAAVNLFPAGLRSLIKFWFSGQFLATLKALRKADVVIMGGGGLFSDENPKAVWIWFVQYCWFRLYRKKCACLAQSVGPLRGKLAKWLTAKVFGYAKLVTVRDAASDRLLKSIGVDQAIVLADAAFAIGYVNQKARHLHKQMVLSLRNWPSLDNDKLSEIAGLIDWLGETQGVKTVFLPFQQRIEDDRQIYQSLQKMVKRPAFFSLREVADYREALEIIGRSRLVLGMRLHSVIFSMLECRPFLALSYSDKVKDLVNEAGFGELVIRLEVAEKMNLRQKVQKLIDSETAICGQLEHSKLKNTYRFFEQQVALKRLL